MPKKSSRPALSQDRIVAAALLLVNEKGLDALSMRGLAAALGVEPMSLYHWIKSRDHLLDALLDEFLKEISAPECGSWSERLEDVSHQFRAACHRYPGLVPNMVVHRFNTKVALGVLEGLLEILTHVHRDDAVRAVAFRLYIHWLIGFCLDEAAGFSKGPTAQEPPTDDEVAALFPHVARLGPFNQPEHFDALFSHGLKAVVGAIRALTSANC
jgi:AcrR family transcriptional regulator